MELKQRILERKDQTTPGDRGGKSKSRCAEGTRDRIWKIGSGSVTRDRNQPGRSFQSSRCGRRAADLRLVMGKCGSADSSGEGKIYRGRLGKKDFRSERICAFEGGRVGEESIYRRERK